MSRVRADDLPPIDETTRSAWSALMRGQATEGQQKIAMRHLLGEVCGVLAIERADMSEGERAFAAGRRYVGLTVATIARATLLTFPAHPASTEEA